MKIWIDADACPKVIKDILFRAAIRTNTHLMIVANHPLPAPSSPFIKRVQVNLGLDIADKYILDNMKKGDLVVTADIPLADGVITQGGCALNPRGEWYSEHNIKQHLSFRNLNEALRSCQLISGGPPQISQKEVRQFANGLDKFIHQKREI